MAGPSREMLERARRVKDLDGLPRVEIGTTDSFFAAVDERFGRLDLLLHSVAFAPREALEGDFLATSREAFRVAHDVSAYSLIALAREALRDLLSIQNRQISVENIQKTVADFYKIKVADMYSKKRPASIAKPRQIAMYLAKELTQKSLPEIGELFGGRDHTTVLHAVRKVAGERGKDTELNQQLHVLEQTLKG